MKKKLIVIMVLMLTFFIKLDVKAIKCGDTMIENLKKEAQNIKIKYVFNEEQEHFWLEIFNLTDKMYLLDINDQTAKIESIDESNSIRIPIYGVDNVNTITFKVYLNDKECYSESLGTVSITLPRVNDLANSELCYKAPNYKWCNKLIDTNEDIAYSDFEKEINDIYNKNVKKELVIGKNFKVSLPVVIGFLLVVLVASFYIIKKIFENKNIIDRGL